MPPSTYRFGPFVVDRAAYRVSRGADALDLSPKLLDLLLHLLDHAGTLVTKEALLDALWPGANVTDNALTQAVSELRQALGDDASSPRFIRTVARRGYRFVAAVDGTDAVADATIVDERAVAVLDFTNVTGDADSAWLSAGIAETVSGDLRALGRFRVIDRRRVTDAARRTGGALQDVAAALGTRLAVVGSFHASLDAYRAVTEGWLRIESLDIRELPRAIADFDRAVTIDPDYALACTGLATAEFASYESTRCENEPARALLDRAIAHGRRAVQLDDWLAEGHGALALILVSAWETPAAIAAARRAIAIEPGNWRHLFRLGHAAWGDERLRAGAATLALYPDFAFAFFQSAMVHVARGRLDEAERVLRHGAAVQDRQIGRGERYPALGLHWLLGLVRLAQNDLDEASAEFDREQELAQPHRLYGREYAMHAHLGRGAVRLQGGDAAAAIESFHAALELYPDYAPASIGIARALDTLGRHVEAAAAFARAEATLPVLERAKPIEAALVRGQLLAARGDADGASAIFMQMLEQAPPGFAGWTLPVEPHLHQVADSEAVMEVMRRLSARAQ